MNERTATSVNSHTGTTNYTIRETSVHYMIPMKENVEIKKVLKE